MRRGLCLKWKCLVLKLYKHWNFTNTHLLGQTSARYRKCVCPWTGMGWAIALTHTCTQSAVGIMLLYEPKTNMENVVKETCSYWSSENCFASHLHKLTPLSFLSHILPRPLPDYWHKHKWTSSCWTLSVCVACWLILFFCCCCFLSFPQHLSLVFQGRRSRTKSDLSMKMYQEEIQVWDWLQRENRDVFL